MWRYTRLLPNEEFKMNLKALMAAGIFGTSMMMSGVASAATDIQWWHAHSARLGEVVNEICIKIANPGNIIFNIEAFAEIFHQISHRNSCAFGVDDGRRARIKNLQ